jgi:tetratricopeptide (TPR) repeat protein
MKHSVAILVLATLIAMPAALAQPQPATAEKLGTVHFPVSCTPDAQKQFERAVAMLHSFWYPQDLNAFVDVTKTDPTCAMAYWGIAMSRRGNPLIGEPEPAVLKDGLEAAAKARAAGARTQREQDYIAAIEVYYKDFEKVDYPARVLAYEKAMEQMYLHYPDDLEAAIFYALSLDEAAVVLPPDKNYTLQLKAAGILQKTLAGQPDHPGALHYAIHSYDFPPLAEQGLPAAGRYGGVAPSAPHALHMPSHIYSMLGMWQDSIKSNQAALSVAKNYVHAMDFMVYAYLQGAQDAEAKRMLDQSAALLKSQAPPATMNPTAAGLAPFTALAAIPARYAIERGAWADAAALEPQGKTAVADAITYFTRAMGSARSGDLPGARKNLERLEVIKEGLLKSKQDYWAEQVEIQRTAAAAWIAFTESKKDDAFKLMRAAADREDASEKHVAMENRLWPMRELLGDLLLAAGKPAEALREYETSLRAAPNRYRGFYGAAKAAERSGDREKARSYYAKLVSLCSLADAERPELAEARKYLARK